MDILNNHVTIRKFKQKEISDDLLEDIIYSGTRASTTGNMQLYSIIISKERKAIETLAPFHFNQPVALHTPVILTVVADFNRFTKWCQTRNANPGYNNFLSFFTAATDAMLFAQNICVAAESKGLGICYLGTTVYNAGEIISCLKIPKLCFPVTSIALGYPEIIPPQTDRIPLNSIIHKERYNDYTEGDISEIYREKENLPDSLKYVKENNKETLAQVYTDVRYKEKDNLFFSEKMIGVLKEQGFPI